MVMQLPCQIESNDIRLAGHIDKIFRGANPAVLPVEEPTRYEFVVNQKTAKLIGVTIPQDVLLRADRVIDLGCAILRREPTLQVGGAAVLAAAVAAGGGYEGLLVLRSQCGSDISFALVSNSHFWMNAALAVPVSFLATAADSQLDPWAQAPAPTVRARIARRYVMAIHSMA